MSWNLCSSHAAIAKAGANANSAIIASGSVLGRWSDESEGYLITETRRDWINSPASGHTSGAIQDIVSSHIANKIINYDMSGYTSRTESQTMLNVNSDIIRKGIEFLKQKEIQEKM